MKVANIRESRNKATTYLKKNDNVLIARHGKITKLPYPIKETNALPDDLRNKALNTIVSSEQGDAKALLLKKLKSSLKKEHVDIEKIYTLQKQWKFKGSLSEDVAAERKRRSSIS